jgi:Flp pilus assembly protein TadG
VPSPFMCKGERRVTVSEFRSSNYFRFRVRSGISHTPTGADEGRRGQVIVMVVIAITVLIALVGLANDVGYAWRAKLQMQSAADAAALAGIRRFVHGRRQ